MDVVPSEVPDSLISQLLRMGDVHLEREFQTFLSLVMSDSLVLVVILEFVCHLL